MLGSACGGLVQSSCFTTAYRGRLVFCRTMNQIGPCPSARVDATGHYRISLHPGRWAMIAAPGRGNIVFVKPRWVSVGMGQTRVLDIDGASQMR